MCQKDNRPLSPIIKWTVPREHLNITLSIIHKLLSLCFNGIQSTKPEEETFSPLTRLQFSSFTIPSDVDHVTYVIKLTARQLNLKAILFYFDNSKRTF